MVIAEGTVATKTMLIRDVEADVAARMARGAKARGIRMGEYLGRLVALHDSARALAADGDGVLAAELDALGLTTVAT